MGIWDRVASDVLGRFTLSIFTWDYQYPLYIWRDDRWWEFTGFTLRDAGIYIRMEREGAD